MVEEANQSGYWNSCQVIAIAFMSRLLKYSNQRNNILGGQVLNQDAGQSIKAEQGYTKAWRVVKQLDHNNHGKKFEWKDIVPKSSIILFELKLTSNNHLRKLTVDHLKTYLELKESNYLAAKFCNYT